MIISLKLNLCRRPIWAHEVKSIQKHFVMFSRWAVGYHGEDVAHVHSKGL